MKQLLLLLAFTSICVATTAQTDEALIKATVNKLFTAMKTADPAMLTSCFTDSALLQTIDTDKQGNAVVKNEAIADFIKQIIQIRKGVADERITFSTVQIDGVLDNVWTLYNFYYKGNFSHCGVNNFVFVKQNNEWKIQYIIDTKRNQGCGL